MLHVVFGAAAQAELREAAEWYGIRGAWVRESFIEQVDRTASRIEENPLQFPIVIRTDVRRARLNRFPYALFFRVQSETGYVLACFHSSRDPRRIRLRT